VSRPEASTRKRGNQGVGAPSAPCRALLGETHQKHIAPPVAGANRDGATIGSEAHRRDCLGPRVAHDGEHFLAVRPDHLARAIDDYLRRIYLIKIE
jgi:hypothetical protein